MATSKQSPAERGSRSLDWQSHGTATKNGVKSLCYVSYELEMGHVRERGPLEPCKRTARGASGLQWREFRTEETTEKPGVGAREKQLDEEDFPSLSGAVAGGTQ